MEHPNKDIGSYFKSQWDQLDIEPTANLWLKVERELPRKKKSKRVIFWLFTGLSIVGITLFIPNSLTERGQDNGNEKKSKNLNHEGIQDKIVKSTNSIPHFPSKNELTQGSENIGLAPNSFQNSVKFTLHRKDSKDSRNSDLQPILNPVPKTNSRDKINPEINTLTLSTHNQTNEQDLDNTPLTILACEERAESKKKEKKIPSDSTTSPVKQTFWVGGYAKGFGTDFDSNASLFVNSAITKEMKRLNYGVGLLFKWQWDSHWSAQTGLGVLNLTHAFEANNQLNVFNEQNVNLNRSSQEMNILLANQNSFEIIHRTRFVEIPLEFSRIWKTSQMTLTATAGLSGWILLDNEIAVRGQNLNEQIIGNLEIQNKFTTSFNFRAGIEFKIWKEISGFIEPGLQLQILPVTNDRFSIYKHYLIQTGIHCKI